MIKLKANTDKMEEKPNGTAASSAVENVVIRQLDGKLQDKKFYTNRAYSLSEKPVSYSKPMKCEESSDCLNQPSTD
jgi:hypothetical protein